MPLLLKTSLMRCRYYLRFADPTNDTAPIGAAEEKYWLPVDLYVGGGEHSCLHLLYARFWHKVLYDCGVVSSIEPFKKLVCQGMVLGPLEHRAFVDTRSGRHVCASDRRVGEAAIATNGGGGGTEDAEVAAAAAGLSLRSVRVAEDEVRAVPGRDGVYSLRAPCRGSAAPAAGGEEEVRRPPCPFRRPF
jgi:hypothetical protein